MKGKLFVVSTPIGNMEDLSTRAVKVLNSVNVIACEDTRKTGMFLNTLGIKQKRLISYYEQNEFERIPEIVQLIKEGLEIALISNAGTPTISDPGFKLVRECRNQGISVESVPGASAMLTALTSSGLPTDKFFFLGFPPPKRGKRINFLKNFKDIDCTFIIYESPYRLVSTLVDLKTVFGNIDVSVCRELTKVFEEIRKEKIDELINHYKNNIPKGEITLLFHKDNPK